MAQNTRIEHDLVGDKEVPADAYYAVHTVRAVENFAITGSTIAQFPELIASLAAVKQAAATAHRDLGLLSQDLAGRIIAAREGGHRTLSRKWTAWRSSERTVASGRPRRVATSPSVIPHRRRSTMKFNALLTNAVIFHNALDIAEIVRQLKRRAGRSTPRTWPTSRRT